MVYDQPRPGHVLIPQSENIAAWENRKFIPHFVVDYGIDVGISLTLHTLQRVINVRFKSDNHREITYSVEPHLTTTSFRRAAHY